VRLNKDFFIIISSGWAGIKPARTLVYFFAFAARISHMKDFLIVGLNENVDKKRDKTVQQGGPERAPEAGYVKSMH